MDINLSGYSVETTNEVYTPIHSREAEQVRNLNTRLMRFGVIYKKDKPEVWNSLLRYRDMVQSDLNRFGVHLKIVDTGKSQYACTMNMESGDDENVMKMCPKKTLAYLEGIIALKLRMLYHTYEANADERCIVDFPKLLDEIYPFVKKHNDEAIFRNRVNEALGKLKKVGIISMISSDTNEIEVCGVIKEIISMTALKNLDDQLKKLAQHNSDADVLEEE